MVNVFIYVPPISMSISLSIWILFDRLINQFVTLDFLAFLLWKNVNKYWETLIVDKITCEFILQIKSSNNTTIWTNENIQVQMKVQHFSWSTAKPNMNMYK